MEGSPGRPDLKLVAQAHCEQDSGSLLVAGKYGNYFRSAQWSPDGTCLIVNSSANTIQTFIVPPELLDQRDSPLQLQPYSATESRDAADAIVCFPGYDLQEVSTTLVLSAMNEHPVRLHSALTGSLVASYPLVNPNTEAFIKPQSMTFNVDGSQFIAGSQNLISLFDVSRPGTGPLLSIKTGPKKGSASWSNPTHSLRGLVSALAVDGQYNVLAAGTFSRQVGLYDAAGQGECISVFSISETDAEKGIGGNGVTQLTWSACGRYLYIAERKSDGILLYDVRQTGQLVSWLCGRDAVTNQRMNIDLKSHAIDGGHKAWAGGQDGKLRHWTNAHLQEGQVDAVDALQVHEDLVHSVGTHPFANVIVTACGQRAKETNFSADLNGERAPQREQSSLKLWHSSSSASEI